MDTIVRKVCSESSKSRLPGLLPFMGGESGSPKGNYGEVVYNIDLTKLSGDDEYSALADLGVMSYRSFIDRYHWIRRFFNKCTYYKPIIKASGTKWILMPNYSAEEQYVAYLINDDLAERIFRMGYSVYDINFVESVDEISATTVEVNTICGVMEDENEEEYTYEKFQYYGGLLFYKFAERAIGKIIIPEEIQGSLVPNYIYLTDIADFCNDMTTKYHNPNYNCNTQRYHEMGGDQILAYLANFDEDYINSELEYFSKLKSNDELGINLKISINTSYDDMGIMRIIGKNFVPGYFYKKGDTVIYNNDAYTCLADITLSNVDSASDLTNASYWVINAPETANIRQTISYTGESLLLGLRSFKRSYSDDGTELPGILSEQSTQLVFPYQEGIVKNAYKRYDEDDNPHVYADSIYSIVKDTENMTYTFNYVIGGEMAISQGTYGEEYAYDASSDTGVKYEESYPYVVSSVTATVGGTEVTFTYDYIDFEAQYQVIEGEQGLVANMQHYSGSLFERSIYIGWNQTYADVYRNPLDFGLTESIFYNDGNIEIDRGTNAAFEKHFKLMEMNQVQDMEEYENNYFNLRNA